MPVTVAPCKMIGVSVLVTLTLAVATSPTASDEGQSVTVCPLNCRSILVNGSLPVLVMVNVTDGKQREKVERCNGKYQSVKINSE